MPTAAEISALIGTVGPALGLDTDHEWLYGDALLDMDTYHRAVIGVMGDYGPEALAAIPSVFEVRAKSKGFRLLKVELMGSPMSFGSYTMRTYSAYAASDVWEKPIKDLSAALYGAPIAIDSAPVSITEKAALDAIWISKDATLPKVEHEITVTKGLTYGLAAILGVSLLFWATTRAK
jgi:hypothetical protein